ncbi:MAG: GNAT family N-acetyltransferase, partial [Candidatus Nomurabacteria bacterium]|nr:GNAT family N-acetyltransferase [Candidatus Nomurabacteria bacterium]
MKAFKKWLKIKADESNGLNPTKKTDFIPMTVFWVEKNSEIVGLVKMRHCLNERTEKYGGHIGIGGVPERFRGQGIGTKTLGLACQKLFEMGENKVLLTAHENNVASRAVIEKNGGKFEDMLDDPEYENTKLARYWIESSVVKNTTPKKLKIGVIKEFMGDGVDEDVKERTRQFVKKLTAVGHSVSEVSLPMVKYALPIYYIVVPAEISSNLARYDGVRYGARSGASKTLAEVYGQSRDAGFVDENKRRIMIGSYVLSSGFFDAYYLQAQKARTLLIAEFDKLFAEYDFLIGPVAPTPAYKIGENISDPIKMYLADIMTVPAS